MNKEQHNYPGKRPNEESALVRSWLLTSWPWVQIYYRGVLPISQANEKSTWWDYCTNDIFFNKDVKLLICEKLNSDELMEASGSIAPGLAMANGPLSGPHSPKTLKQKLFVSATLDPGSGQDHSKVLHKILKSTDHCTGVNKSHL